ncbi:TIGR03087 family PEP-CTERM/XrtA system glycosyltransferase [Alienimonas californiensis]|uniref:D-inositol-3-phosphate glycosyltransferase n=1 Tax=Alienimonas californiensis TaxID=2527989 RepID=A0A517P491_9PLAN|nr:TIGR03087 family PEP-CTERM/XrtA system glycosyltransferase [Alienimonas californiensis]QDT14190.1 D-inositol-3-phosphate glycosyltransferase [Alienimonas californiensis]
MLTVDPPTARAARADAAGPRYSSAVGGARPRVLYLVHRFPYPPDKGDRIRAFHILRTLQSRCDVSVVTFADEPVAPERRAELEACCSDLRVIPVGRAGRAAGAAWGLLSGRSATEGAFASGRFADAVREIAATHRPDAVLLSCGGLGRYLDLPALAGVRTVVDFVDLDSRKWADYAAGCGRTPSGLAAKLLYRTESKRLRAAERRLVARCDAATFVTEAEAELGRRELTAPGEHKAAAFIHAVTNGVDLDYFRPAEPPPPPLPTGGRVVFLGAMDYRPNVNAVTWFVREVWPQVRETRPEATFEIVGRRPTPAVTALHGRDGVTVTGSVPDVRPHLAAAHVAVTPLRIARGLQNKVLEAMAAGVPVIASPAAAEGLLAVAGQDYLAAAAPAEWANEIVGLFANEDRRRALASAGRCHVEERHDWRRCVAPLFELLDLTPAGGRS